VTSFFRAPTLASIPMQQLQVIYTLHLFFRLLSLLTHETQSQSDALLELNLNSEQIFICSAFCEQAPLLMYSIGQKLHKNKENQFCLFLLSRNVN